MKKAIRLLILVSLIICCLLAVCSCGRAKALPKPERVEIDEATLVLSWKTVRDARMYTISIENESGEVTVSDEVRRGALLPLERMLELGK